MKERKSRKRVERVEAREVGETGEVEEESEVGEEGKSEGEEKKERTPFDEMMKRLADASWCGTGGVSGGDRGDSASCEAVGGEVEMTHRLTDRVYRVKTPNEGEEESF